MASKIIIGPTEEPITLAEAAAHLRVNGADDDAYIAALIISARQSAESYTRRALMAQTWELALDAFDKVIILPRPPLISVISINYLDESGALQTLDANRYVLDDYSAPAKLTPATGTAWPTTRCRANAVIVRYVAGYASAAAVPQEIKSWMLLRIGMLYENRESVIAGERIAAVPFVDSFLDAHKVWDV